MNFKERFKAKFYGRQEKVEVKKEEPILEKTEDKYYSYYLFGKAIKKNIWDYISWRKCASLFQPIINLSSNVPYIRTEQSVPHYCGKNNQYVSYDNGGLRFGKMLWSESNNEKWTTKYAKEDNWKFFDTEIAYPTRSACKRNNINPELLIIINNENLSSDDSPIIDQSITIHINTGLIVESEILELEKHITKIGKQLNLVIGGKIVRKDVFKSHVNSLSSTDSIWQGTYGVLNSENNGFSINYQKNGIEKWGS